MKKQLITFVLFVYTVPISASLVFSLIWLQFENYSFSYWPFALPITLMVVVCHLMERNISAGKQAAKEQTFLSFRTVLKFKLLLIPFHVINFVCWAIGSLVLIAWPILPFVVAFTYFTLLGTSTYHIAHLSVLYQNGTITRQAYKIHRIFQHLFVIDILDSIYLTVKYTPLDAALPCPTPQD